MVLMAHKTETFRILGRSCASLAQHMPAHQKPIHPAKLGKYNLKPSKDPRPEKRINPPTLNPALEDPDQFSQLSGQDALKMLVKILSYPIPASIPLTIARETALEKLHARAWLVWGLDAKRSINLNVSVLSGAGGIVDVDSSVQPQKCIHDHNTIDAQVVDPESFDPGI